MEEGEENPRAVEKRQHNLWLFLCSPLILFSADGAVATEVFASRAAGGVVMCFGKYQHIEGQAEPLW